MASQKVSRIQERQQQSIKVSRRERLQSANLANRISEVSRRIPSLSSLRSSLRSTLKSTRGRVRGRVNRIKLSRAPWPAIGAALAGGVGITAAATVGVGELALGLAASYATYRMLRERRSSKHLLNRKE